MEENSFALLHPDRLTVVQHPAIDGKRTVADFVAMRHAFGEGSLHGRLALLFQRLHLRRGRKKVHWHISAAAERGLELLQHQKDLAIIVARRILWFDIDCTNLAVVLPGVKIGSGSIVRVIETKARRSWHKYNSTFAARGNKRCALFRRSVNVNRNHLAMPMQLLRDIGFVVNIYGYLLSFFQAQQRPGKLSVVSG